MSEFAKAIADSTALVDRIEESLSSVRASLAEVVNKRRPLALASELGDAASRKTLAGLSNEEAALERRQRDLGFALDAAKAQLEKDRTRAESASRDAAREECARHAEDALMAAKAMDEAARELAEAQRRLVAAHRAMSATGILSSGALNRLIYRASATRALVHHGFAAFSDLPRAGDPLGNQTFEELTRGVVGAVAKREVA